MTLEEAISDVITNNFSAGDLFDSHAVINELIKDKEKHLVYMQSFGNRGSLENYHSIISKKIEESRLCERVGDIKTHTIYGKLSSNALWKRV